MYDRRQWGRLPWLTKAGGARSCDAAMLSLVRSDWRRRGGRSKRKRYRLQPKPHMQIQSSSLWRTGRVPAAQLRAGEMHRGVLRWQWGQCRCRPPR